MARKWTGTWAGGRTRDADGQLSWVIERMKGGRRYNITLEVHSEVDAMAELALFDRDPDAYVLASKTPKSSPQLSADFSPDNILRFTAFKMNKVTKAWLKELHYYLKGWLGVLGDRDLRTVTLAEYNLYLDKLAPHGNPRKYIIAIRAYTKWLRKVGQLTPAQDASLALSVPQPSRPKVDVGYDMEAFEKLYANIRGPKSYSRDGGAQAARDTLVLRALVGMHHTEINRLAKGGGEVKRVEGHGDIKGTARFIHKSGEPHTVSLNAQALAAAERLQLRRRAPTKSYIRRLMREAALRVAGLEVPTDTRKLLKAVKDPRVKLMRPGQLRHSFVTWSRTYGHLVRPAEGMGVSLDDIAKITGHAGSKTTKKHYDGTLVPEMIELPIRLVNQEDPPLAGTATVGRLRVVAG